jgi:ABC-type transport system substrate-binding protein
MDGLTELDATGAVRPALATQWSSQSVEHRWEFRIRTNVHFHDGTLLTPEIAAAALAKECVAHCPWNGVHTVGQSVIFTSDSPMADLPIQLARSAFLISHTNAQGMPDGTGPFVPDASSSSSIATFVTATEDSWRARPYVDSIEVHAHRSIREQWLDLGIGRADVVDAPPALLPQARQQRLTIITSGPVDLLVLQAMHNGSLAEDKIRQAVALAVDRSALYNVIFQKQGEITASLLPASLSGYSFLFTVDRDIERAQELRGGSTPQLILAAEDSSPELQLCVERLAINLREAGFKVQVAPSATRSPDIVLRRLHLETSSPRAALENSLSELGSPAAVTAVDPAALYDAERDFLDRSTAVPLLYLPRCYATGERVRDLRLAADGTPLFADTSVWDAK